MLGYAKLCYSYAQLCSIMLHIMPIMLDYANYALCSDSAIMPKSNAGIIGLAQVALGDGVVWCVAYSAAAASPPACLRMLSARLASWRGGTTGVGDYESILG